MIRENDAAGQMVTAVQALVSIRQLEIDWVDPVRAVISITQARGTVARTVAVPSRFGR